jgi:MFS family permease
MLTSYRRVFAHPGALAFSLTGLVARLPIAMMTLGIVLLVSAQTGSYAFAGQVSAAYIAGNAVFAVAQGRLVDRFGQAPVLYVTAVLYAAATGLMVLAIEDASPTPVPHLLAALSGAAMPSFGGLVRSRWAHLLTQEADRHTAFSVEGVFDEVVFVTGPTLVTFLSTLHAPSSGLLVALVLGSVGAVVLALQRRTEPPAHRHDTTTARAPIPWAVLLPLTVAATALGSLFGAQEVATVAIAGDEGHRAFAGVMLGIFALGSGLAGVVSGAMTFRRTAVQRTRIGLLLLAVGVSTLPLLPGLVSVSVALFLTGLALAPTLIATFSIIEGASPRSRLNEAMGIVQTGVSAGIAPGAWVAGVVADNAGGSSAYWVGAVSALVAAAAMFLVPQRTRHPVSAVLDSPA